MAIAIDASTPSVTTGTGGGSITSGSFSPPAGSLLVVMVNGGWNSGSNTTVSSITDSGGGGAWSDVEQVSCTQDFRGCSAVGFKYFASAPGSITVTANYSNLSGGRYLNVQVLTGAASDQSGAATANLNKTSSSGTTFSQSITTTEAGSWVFGCSNLNDTGFGGNNNWSPVSGTTELHEFDNTSDDLSQCSFRRTSATGTPGTVTAGENSSIAARGTTMIREVLEDSGPVTPTGTLEAAAPVATASVSGSTTAPPMTFVGESHTPGQTTYAGSVTIDVPAGVEEGDLLLAAVGGTRASAPSGWTLIGSAAQGSSTGTVYFYYRFAGASEDDYTFSFDGSKYSRTHTIAAYRGVDPENPISDSDVKSDSGTSFDTNSVTALEGDWIVSFAGHYTFGDETVREWEANNGTERADYGNSPGTDENASSCWYDSAGGVSAGSHSRTHTASASTSVGVTGIVALTPAEDPTVTGELATTAPGATAGVTGTVETPAGVLAASAPAVEAEILAERTTPDGTLDAEAPAASGVFSGSFGGVAAGILSAVSPAAQGSFEGESPTVGALAAEAPAAAFSATAEHDADGVLSAVAPAATGTFGGSYGGEPTTGELSAVAPAATAGFGGGIPIQISFVGESHTPGYGDSYSNGITIDVPAGVEEGDILLAFVGGDRSGGVPSGWTEIFNEDHGTSGGTAYLYYRFATADEPDSYDFPLSGEHWSQAAIITAYRGVDTEGPIADFSSQGDSGTSYNPAAVTASSGDWVVSLASQYTFSGSQSTWSANNGEERAEVSASASGTEDASMCWYDSDGGVTAGDHSRVHTASSTTSVGVTGMVVLARAETPVTGSLDAGVAKGGMPTAEFEGMASTGGVLAASAPAPGAEVVGAVSQEVDGVLTASAPAAVVDAEGGSPNTAVLGAVAPVAEFRLSSETRVIGERVVRIDAEDRGTVVPYEALRLQTVAAEERLTVVPQDKPTERFEV